MNRFLSHFAGALVLAAFGAACSDHQPLAPDAPSVQLAPTSASSAPAPSLAASATESPPAPTDAGVFSRMSSEGQMCGGLIGKMCQPGLLCTMMGPPHPDQSGVCRTK